MIPVREIWELMEANGNNCEWADFSVEQETAQRLRDVVC